MNKLIFFLALLFLFCEGFSQTFYATTDSTYVSLVEKAMVDLQSGACEPCLQKYETAFTISERSILSRLRAAVCAFECKQEARWKFHLDFALEKDWASVENILIDPNNQYPEITKYRESTFYSTAHEAIKTKKKETGYDEFLAAEMEVIMRDDQAIRQKLSNLTSEEESQKAFQKMIELDSINLLKVEKIFAEKGYPGKSKVGVGLSSAAFLVIQHADLDHQAKYFPLIEKAANDGELNKSSFALLVDRVRIHKGEKQLYGSQVLFRDNNNQGEFYPIEDEVNVNKRRAEMGLEPIEKYAERFGIQYFPGEKKD